MPANRLEFASEASPEADLAQPSDPGVIQCPEDNPRALVPETMSSAERVRLDDIPEMVTPANHLDDIPQLLSRSSWARRDARAKRLHQYIPGLIYALLVVVFILVLLAWYALAIAAAATVPGILTMLTGNAICKAANLPHFTSLGAPMTVGAIGSFWGTGLAFLFICPLGKLAERVDKRYKERLIRSGRISRHSTRTDGHFPVLLLPIPVVYLLCFLSGPISTSFNWVMTGNVRELSKANIVRMGAIGALFVAPVWVPVALLIYGVFEKIYQFVCEVLDGRAEQEEPSTLPYLWRQGEALVWLFKPVPPNVTSTTSISTNV